MSAVPALLCLVETPPTQCLLKQRTAVVRGFKGTACASKLLWLVHEPLQAAPTLIDWLSPAKRASVV